MNFKSCFILLFALVLGNGLKAQNYEEADTVNLVYSDLPIIIINTNGQEIVDDPKIEAYMGIIDNGDGNLNYVTDSCNGYNGKIGIELRGQTSQDFPKKPYGFETRDSTGEDMDAPLLGMPAESDWILYASYNDKSLIRDELEYYLSSKLGWYASRFRYCELVLNGHYQGIYVLLEKIKRGKGRVNISKLKEGDIEGDNVTGGYIVKIDKESPGDDGWDSKYPVDNERKIRFLYHYPKPEDIVDEQKAYIKNYISEFEEVLKSDGFADSVNGYAKYIDVNSFVDYFILTELSKNIDGYRISAYMYKDKDSKGGKLTMGPLWDFNVSYGNCDYDNGQYSSGWQMDYVKNYELPFWWKRLLSDYNFANKAYNRWHELREGILSYDSLRAYVINISNLSKNARERNFNRWPIWGVYVWPNYHVSPDYQDELNYLLTWIASRLSWLDKNMVGKPIANEDNDNNIIPSYSLAQNYPNPFNPSTVINYKVAKEGLVELKAYDVLGNEIQTLVKEYKGAGEYSVIFNAGHNLAGGVYFYRLTIGNFTETKKMLLLK